MMGKVLGAVCALLLVGALGGCDGKGKAGATCASHTDCGAGLVCGKDKKCQSSVAETKPSATSTASGSGGPAVAATGKMPAEIPVCFGREACPPGDFEGCTKLCDEGNAVACSHLWKWYGFDSRTAAQHDEDKKTQFQKKQVELDEAGCKKGDSCACSRLFNNYAKGYGADRSDKTAVSRAERACELGDPGSCEILGDVYLNGLPIDVGKDPTIANKHYVRAAALRKAACDREKLIHCAYLGSMYVEGMGVKRSTERGISLARRACSGGEPMGCMLVGGFYRSGRPGIKKNPRTARDAYQQACKLRFQDGCVEAKKVESENPAG